jgi:RNA polymerase sigma factor (sigma-70 family)
MDSQPVAVADLIRTCVESGDQIAWDDFVERFNRVIESTVVRTCRLRGVNDPSLMADLIQDTYVKICSNRCRVLREFDPRHPNGLYGLLKITAYSVVQDHFRAAGADKRRGASETASLDEESMAANQEAAEEIERAVLIGEIRSRLQSFSARDQWIFWLYFRHGLSARAISGIPALALTQKGVESTIQRMTHQLRTELAGSAPKGNAQATAFHKGET